MKKILVKTEKKCWKCKWVHKFYKNFINYSECPKCKSRKAAGPESAPFSLNWLDGKTDMVKSIKKNNTGHNPNETKDGENCQTE